MTPIEFLIFLVGITALAGVLRGIHIHRYRRRLRILAQQAQMHYASVDRLRLISRVAGRFSVPGASDIRLRDLMFKTEDHWHRYLFTVEYSTGIVRGKRRRARVGGFVEPVTRADAPPAPSALLLAPIDLPITAQYESLRGELQGLIRLPETPQPSLAPAPAVSTGHHGHTT